MYRSTYNQSFGLFAQPLTGVVRVLLVVNLLVFILQWVGNAQIIRLLGPEAAFAAERIFGLSRADFFLWQLVTYMFLHGNLVHLMMNMLILYFLGTEVERVLGSRNFLWVYFVSGLLGGLGWLALAGPQDICIGASGAIFGLLGAFVALFPQRHITVLVFFILPITLRAWMLAAILAGLEFLWMTQGTGRSGIAHSAHLAGLVAGYMFAYVAFRKGGLRIRLVRSPRNPAGLKVLRREDAPRESSAISPAAIDAILDKIAHEGMQSLTRKERALLEQAATERRK